ncbi:MAG: basic amino acid ABC transporter substrate-binding protein [Spirochaetia bacterium]|jgi:polar amino acid transport system substrate-binding protein|nr:basic amino acid ABC transporter substrate-binding protein [Spirochaetia bacterium]
MKKILLILLAAVLIFGIASCSKKEQAAGEKKVITIASDATWPPMEFVDENKELVGFNIDLMHAAAEAGGYEIVIKNTAWDGIFAGLANGEYDAVCSSVTITEERKETMDFSIPYVNAGQVLMVSADNNTDTLLADLKGKDVGAQIGTTGAIEIQNTEGVILKTYDEIGLAIADLANGRIAGVVADAPIAADFVLQNEEYKKSLKIVGVPFTDEYYGVAVKKGNKEVLDIINAGLKKVIDSGKAEELEDKWLR